MELVFDPAAAQNPRQWLDQHAQNALKAIGGRFAIASNPGHGHHRRHDHLSQPQTEPNRLAICFGRVSRGGFYPLARKPCGFSGTYKSLNPLGYPLEPVRGAVRS